VGQVGKSNKILLVPVTKLACYKIQSNQALPIQKTGLFIFVPLNLEAHSEKESLGEGHLDHNFQRPIQFELKI
jgi:hypothetical protein